MPTGDGAGVAWSFDSQYLSVSHTTSPFMSVYQRSGTTFTRLDDPSSLPTDDGNGTDWSPDGQYVGFVGDSAPFLDIYGFENNTLTRVANPASLPLSISRTIAWSNNGEYVVVGSNGGANPPLNIYQTDTTLPTSGTVIVRGKPLD